MILRLQLFFLFLFFSSSFCVAQDSLQLNYDSVSAKIVSNQISYKTISLRSRMIWNDGNTEQEFLATIRIKKDSVIWLSLGLFGIEGARVVITPDSFFLINKLSNEYLARDFSYIENWLTFPVNFKMLQQILGGEKISIATKTSFAAKEDSAVALYDETDKLYEKARVNNTNYTIENILLKDKLLKQDLSATFTSYNLLREKPFSYRRNILINRDSQRMNLQMEILKATVDSELSFPFEVSEKMKKQE
ncbi:MAG: DUF4292 domain-containing protein [Bacteroidetes bacterium]|nr:DUF4292 domain-containing protein [Bacteroidota bacterium]